MHVPPWFVVPLALLVLALDSPSADKAKLFIDTEGTGQTGVGAALVVLYGASQSGKGFGVQVAKEISKQKACSQIEVYSSKEKADYTLVAEPMTRGWNVYRRDGKLVGSGDTSRLSTLAKEVCRAVDKDLSPSRVGDSATKE